MALRRASELQQQVSRLHCCSPGECLRIRQVSSYAYDQRGEPIACLPGSSRVHGTPSARGGSGCSNPIRLDTDRGGLFFFLQGETDGARQIPVRSQEAAPEADDSRLNPRARKAGQSAGPPPGCLHSCQRAAHATHFLQV